MKVILTAAVTVDGFIARSTEHSSFDWTSHEDRKFITKLSKELGVVVTGYNTYKTFSRALVDRKLFVYTRKDPVDVPEGVEYTTLPPKELVARLEREGAKGLTLWGGASIYRQFIRERLVTEMYLTVEPILFGQGVPLFDEPVDTELQLLDTTKLNENTLLLHYAVKDHAAQ